MFSGLEADMRERIIMRYIKIDEGVYKKVSGYTGFYGLFQAIKDIKAIFYNPNLQSYEKAEKIENI